MPENKIEKDDDNIYDREQREEQLAEDEINPEEAGFMEGYEDTKLVECNQCRKGFDWEKVIEREINGTTYTFCSRQCADKFEKKQKA